MTKEEAFERLRPYFPLLRRPIEEAWECYRGKDYSAKAKAVHDSRARANVIYAHTLERALIVFSDVQNARFLESFNLHVLLLEETFLLRYKKLRIDHRSSNVPTKQTDRYRSQVAIPGFPAALHLDIGYIPNATGTGFDSIEVVCPKRNGIHWHFAIPAAEDNVQPLPLLPSVDPSAGGTVIRIKGDSEHKAEEPGGNE
jgi:hypothetical protein